MPGADGAGAWFIWTALLAIIRTLEHMVERNFDKIVNMTTKTIINSNKIITTVPLHTQNKMKNKINLVVLFVYCLPQIHVDTIE